MITAIGGIGCGKITISLCRHPERSEGSKESFRCAAESLFLGVPPRQPEKRHVICRSDERYPDACVAAQGGSDRGFTKQHEVKTLVYVEEFRSIRTAIEREKALKGWGRKRKIALLETTNPDWDDLAAKWFD